MNGFIKKSVGTLTLGEKLQKLRSERRISLHEVSKATQIQLKYLEYLEDGKYDKLPVDVYAKGFLRNYADFLGINENILIKLYEKEKGIKNNLKKNKDPEKKKMNPLKASSFIVTPKIIIVSIISLLVAGGFFYLYKEIGTFASIPRLVITSPENNYSTTGNSVVVEGITDRDSKVFINNQPIMVNDEGRFRENITLQSGTNALNIKAVNRFDKNAEEKLTILSSFQERKTEKDETGTEQLQTEGFKLEVRIDPGPVWLSVEADGNLVFSGTMLSGAQQNFQAKEKITLDSGKANATFLRFNDKDIGVLGESAGPVRSVTFTKDMKF